jgi:hypothetical protein
VREPPIAQSLPCQFGSHRSTVSPRGGSNGGARKGAIEIFKVAGIQVAIDYSWLIVFALILWSLASGYFPSFTTFL